MFPDEDGCRAYLEQLRWPVEFACPACGACGEPWRQTRGRLVCSACRHQTSVGAATILDKTRTPLTTWLEAAWHLTTAKNGLSAKTLERTLGTSYRVAWTMLQRYRVAMVRADREPRRAPSRWTRLDSCRRHRPRREAGSGSAQERRRNRGRCEGPQGLRAGPDAPRPRRLRRQSGAVRLRRRGSRRGGTDRRLERLQ